MVLLSITIDGDHSCVYLKHTVFFPVRVLLSGYNLLTIVDLSTGIGMYKLAERVPKEGGKQYSGESSRQLFINST